MIKISLWRDRSSCCKKVVVQWCIFEQEILSEGIKYENTLTLARIVRFLVL